MILETPVLLCLLLARSGLGALCDPAYGEAVGRGIRHHDAFEYREAADAYAEALDRDPAAFHALAGLANAANGLGEEQDGPEAERSFTRSLGYAQCLQESHPLRPEGHYWAAVAYGQLTASAGAGEKLALARDIERSARQALELDPDFALAYVVLGAYEREMSRLGFFARMAARTFMGGLPQTSLAESERLLRRAVALSPESIVARYELALTLDAAGDAPAARTELVRVTQMLPRERSDRRRQVDAAARLQERRP